MSEVAIDLPLGEVEAVEVRVRGLYGLVGDFLCNVEGANVGVAVDARSQDATFDVS
jgi:hypothetical protein